MISRCSHTQSGLSRGCPELRKRGFTLIELLVVISIISLLIAILMPALAGARSSARSIVCGSQLSQIGVALNLYAVDNDDTYPRLRWKQSVPGQSGTPWQTWFLSLIKHEYITGMESRTVLRDAPGYANSYEIPAGPLACPVAQYRYGFTTDYYPAGTDNRRYGITYGINQRVWRAAHPSYTTHEEFEGLGVRNSWLPQPSGTYMLADATQASRWRNGLGSISEYAMMYNSLTHSYHEFRHLEGEQTSDGNLNQLYFDNHVGSLRREDVSTVQEDVVWSGGM